MVKLIALLVRRRDLSEVEFHRHWRYQHGPLAAQITSMQRYCQCHLVPRPPHDLPIALEFGGTAEVWWEDIAAAERLATDPEYTENALPDEPRFIDMDRMVFMTVAERVLLDGPPTRREAGGVKVIQLLTRAAGTSPDEFRQLEAVARSVFGEIHGPERYWQGRRGRLDSWGSTDFACDPARGGEEERCR